VKIAMMVRGYVPVPRPEDIVYAPIDLAAHIAEGLAARGHEVSFFGPQGTHLHGVIVHTRNMRALVHNQKEFSELTSSTDKLMHYVPQLWDQRFVCDMFTRAELGEFDLLHFHHPEVALPLATRHPSVPVVYTLHDPIYDWYSELFELYTTPNQQFISISDNQRRDAPDLPYTQTIYNGVDLDLFSFSDDHEDYLLFAGRIVPEKGIKEAIKVAQATDHRLLIIGPVYDDHQEYFNQYVKPHLNDKILYLGFIEQQQLVKYYQKAKALLMPIQWEEPFGLTMAEAMACGAPVIALRRGAVPEVVAHNKTGFIVDSIGEMIEAVDKVHRIKPSACRAHVEQHFNVDTMVANYESAFQAILNKKAVVSPIFTEAS
jgi:glycosyltransferase involved in cell wall biosynthesis